MSAAGLFFSPGGGAYIYPPVREGKLYPRRGWVLALVLCGEALLSRPPLLWLLFLAGPAAVGLERAGRGLKLCL